MLAYGVIVVLIGVKKMFFPSDKPLARPLRFAALIFAGLMQGMFTSGGPFLAIVIIYCMKKQKILHLCNLLLTYHKIYV